MPNLEQRIAQWRRDAMTSAGVPSETLDELENHLRESVAELIGAGVDESEAFRRAVAELGSVAAVAAEYRKLDQPAWLPIKWVLGAGFLVALASALLLTARFEAGRSNVLLAVHVFAVMLGYTAAFLIGVLGICYVGRRCRGEFPPMQSRSLTRVTFHLAIAAAGLTALGVILGMIWAKAEWGRYWSWDAKEVGALCILAWLSCFLAVHRWRRASTRGVMVMSVMSNVVVSLGWFGANLVSGPESYGNSSMAWFLAGAVVFHVGVFLVGWGPAGWLRLRRAS